MHSYILFNRVIIGLMIGYSIGNRMIRAVCLEKMNFLAENGIYEYQKLQQNSEGFLYIGEFFEHSKLINCVKIKGCSSNIYVGKFISFARLFG